MNLNQIKRDSIRLEMNHLFWIDEFDNDGNWDSGWSCREHAWALSLLMLSAGEQVECYGGQAFFAPGISKRGRGQAVVTQYLHSWVMLNGSEVFDFSIKSKGIGALAVHYGTPIPIRPVLHSKILSTKKGRVITAGSADEFKENFDKYGSERQASVASYYPSYRDKLLPDFVINSADWINSPLTDRLRPLYGEDIYAKAFLHLCGLLYGRRDSLTRLSSNKSWEIIHNEIPGGYEECLALSGLI